MSKETGGPAFPTSRTSLPGDKDGMTLRDYFAAKAMQGMILLRSYSGTAAEMSAEAYQMADAMLKERNK